MSRLRVFKERVPTGSLVRAGFYLVVLAALCFALLPRDRWWAGLAVLAAALVIPYLALPALFRLSPQSIRFTQWVPAVCIIGMPLLRRPVVADIRFGLLFLGIGGRYLGCYFWLFSDGRFWGAPETANREES